MATATSYLEWIDSQQPALDLLGELGYTVLSPEDALVARDGMPSQVLLTSILKDQLEKLNRIRYKGEEYEFSPENIYAAIDALRDLPNLGLVRTNEKAYDLLTLGKSLEQTVEGDRKSFTLKYIDWDNWDRNVFHVVPEFEVEGLRKRCVPDLVMFVNGIPLVVIECKRRDSNDSLDDAISQQLRNQQQQEGIPRLFHYVQLLLAVQPNEVKYATVGAIQKYWQVWREDGLEDGVRPYVRDRLPTEQDRMLYALCRPERLMELAYQFTLFDTGEKKIARHQQYFAVKETMARVKQRLDNGSRKGGVIWHTQGSGKSLTMVMLGKALALDDEIPNPRVILVTDQVNLDNQITQTFRNCGKEPVQARTGKHLLDLIEDDRYEIMTTVIDKFDAVLKRRDACNRSDNIFVLVDEAHRSQYGRMHRRMRSVLPRACFIAFTGTPLFRREKNTIHRFGELIRPYTIREAEEDKAIVPLLYEGRHLMDRVNKGPLDRGVSRVAEGLTKYQTSLLKKQSATEERVFQAEQNIEEIAYNITQHYKKNWKNTGFKAQLATSSKHVAVQFHEIFERECEVRSAVVISPPDMRENFEDVDDVDDEPTDLVRKFWNRMMKRYGREEDYEREVIDSFKHREDGIELLIVVGKLLTGFDAPRNTVLYLARKMKDHTLLQAIARVNRPFPGKDFGYVVDYRGVLGYLNSALEIYSSPEEFDRRDLDDVFRDVQDEIAKLPQYHSDVWDIFKTIKNKEDVEELERFLGDETIRHDFYEKLAIFARTLHTAFATVAVEKIPGEQLERFENDLKFFYRLRDSVRQRYAEQLHFREYEKRIRKLMDTHVSVDEVIEVTEAVNIFDKEAFSLAVQTFGETPASKADFIVHQVKKTLTERMDEDPALYRQFSDMLEDVIKEFRQKRLTEVEYFIRAQEIHSELTDGASGGMPSLLTDKPQARAYYGAICQAVETRKDFELTSEQREALAQAGLDIEKIINDLEIVDWQYQPDIEKQMHNAVEDRLLMVRDARGLELTFDEIDLVLDQALRIARSRV